VTTPTRAAKAKAIPKGFEVIQIPKHVKNENEEERHGWLKDMQKRQLECVKYENKEQRHTWLENMHTEHVSESKIQMKSKYTGGLKNSRGVSKMKMKSKDKCG